MKVEFWGLSTCDTCRKALGALRAAGHEVTARDVRADGVPPTVLDGWIAALGADALVNRRSATWRGLGQGDRARADTHAGARDLLVAHPTLMKRPVTVAGGVARVGWDADVAAALG